MSWREILGFKPKLEKKELESVEEAKPKALTSLMDGFFGRVSKVMAMGTALLGMACFTSPDTNSVDSWDSGSVSTSSDTGGADIVPTTTRFIPTLEDSPVSDSDTALWSMVDDKVSEVHQDVPDKTQELTTSVITKDLVSSLEVPHGHVKLHSEEGWTFLKGQLKKWGGYDDILKVTEGATTLHQATMFLRTTDQLPGSKADRIKMGEDLIREAALIPNSKIVTSPQKAKELKRALSTSVDSKVFVAEPVQIVAPEDKDTWIVSVSAPSEPEVLDESDPLPPRPHTTGVIGYGEPTEPRIKELAKKKEALNAKSNVLSLVGTGDGAVDRVFGDKDETLSSLLLSDDPQPTKAEPDQPEVDVLAPVEAENPFGEMDYEDWDIDAIDPKNLDPVNLSPRDMDLDADPPEDFGYIPLRTPSLKEMIHPVDGLADPTDCLEPKNFCTPNQKLGSIFDVPEAVSLQRKTEVQVETGVAVSFKAPQECLDPTECPEPGFLLS